MGSGPAPLSQFSSLVYVGCSPGCIEGVCCWGLPLLTFACHSPLGAVTFEVLACWSEQRTEAWLGWTVCAQAQSSLWELRYVL